VVEVFSVQGAEMRDGAARNNLTPLLQIRHNLTARGVV
jgi:hypothetical protein